MVVLGVMACSTPSSSRPSALRNMRRNRGSPGPLPPLRPQRQCRRIEGQRIKVPGWRISAPSFTPIPLTETASAPVVAISNLTKQFGRFFALRSVTAEFAGGKLYAILGRIRLVSSDAVLTAAEACCDRVVDLYAKPNRTIDEILKTLHSGEFEVLEHFSDACRVELRRYSAY